MRKCKKCGSGNIKSRSNYTHGKKSKATTILTCSDCKSSDIDSGMDNRRRGRKRR